MPSLKLGAMPLGDVQIYLQERLHRLPPQHFDGLAPACSLQIDEVAATRIRQLQLVHCILQKHRLGKQAPLQVINAQRCVIQSLWQHEAHPPVLRRVGVDKHRGLHRLRRADDHIGREQFAHQDDRAVRSIVPTLESVDVGAAVCKHFVEPTRAHGLVPHACAHLQGTRITREGNVIVYNVGARALSCAIVVKIGIVERRARDLGRIPIGMIAHEALRHQAVVFQVGSCSLQCRGYIARDIGHDEFIDLRLVFLVDHVVMRLIARVLAPYFIIAAKSARLKQGIAVRITQNKFYKNAPGRISRWEFVPNAVDELEVIHDRIGAARHLP